MLCLLLHDGLLLPLFGMVILGLCGGGVVTRLLNGIAVLDAWADRQAAPAG